MINQELKKLVRYLRNEADAEIDPLPQNSEKIIPVIGGQHQSELQTLLTKSNALIQKSNRLSTLSESLYRTIDLLGEEEGQCISDLEDIYGRVLQIMRTYSQLNLKTVKQKNGG